MSCSIPYFFDPAKVLYRPSKKVSYIVDGGLLSNFPVWLFDREHPRWPTFGFRLISETEGQPRAIRGPISLFRAMFLTMMEAHDNRHIKEQDRLRTIQVLTKGVSVTDFHISREQRQALYEAGRKAGEAFFSKWRFSYYLAMRSGASPVRYTMRPAPEVEGDGRSMGDTKEPVPFQLISRQENFPHPWSNAASTKEKRGFILPMPIGGIYHHCDSS